MLDTKQGAGVMGLHRSYVTLQVFVKVLHALKICTKIIDNKAVFWQCLRSLKISEIQLINTCYRYCVIMCSTHLLL